MTCSIPDCDRPAVAKNLCQSHYNTQRETARRAAIRGESRPCQGCGGDMAGKRPNAAFCSPVCRYNAQDAGRRAAVAKKREGRLCLVCQQPILSPSTKARCCSKPCSVKWQNMKKMEQRNKVAAQRPPCLECGEAIPVERHLHAVYCSTVCKKKAQDRRWRDNAPHYNRLYLYGITAEDYFALLAQQENRCAVCRTEEWGGKHGVPHVDHDHATNKVRGLLCDSCNAGLGRFRDNPTALRRAADYLER